LNIHDLYASESSCNNEKAVLKQRLTYVFCFTVCTASSLHLRLLVV